MSVINASVSGREEMERTELESTLAELRSEVDKFDEVLTAMACLNVDRLPRHGLKSYAAGLDSLKAANRNLIMAIPHTRWT